MLSLCPWARQDTPWACRGECVYWHWWPVKHGPLSHILIAQTQKFQTETSQISSFTHIHEWTIIIPNINSIVIWSVVWKLIISLLEPLGGTNGQTKISQSMLTHSSFCDYKIGQIKFRKRNMLITVSLNYRWVTSNSVCAKVNSHICTDDQFNTYHCDIFQWYWMYLHAHSENHTKKIILTSSSIGNFLSSTFFGSK